MSEITTKNTIREQVDVCVIGAGHAGCEAALACSRLGLETVIFTVSVDSIALMPCNPNVGGSSKGHLVRELDALGGEMVRILIRHLSSPRCLINPRVLLFILFVLRLIRVSIQEVCVRFLRIRKISLSSRQRFARLLQRKWTVLRN